VQKETILATLAKPFNPFRIKFNLWLDRRIPATNSITLHHRQTFILPSRFGFMMLFILLIMMVAATNYQNSLAFLLTFTLASIGFNVIILTYRNLTGINIKAKTVEAVFAGQPLDIPLVISTTEARHHYSVGFGAKKDIQQVIDIAPDQTVQTLIRVWPTKRGWYSPGRLYTATVYPLGMLRVWSWFKFSQLYLIYPSPLDPGMIEQKADTNLETEQGRMGGGEEDFSGIRSYRKGDPKRKIHWRAYAREQGLHTMEFEEPEGHSSILDFDNFENGDLEHRLSWLCFLVLQSESQGERYGLKLPGNLIEPDSGSKHRQQCLQALALFQSRESKQ
jgi:uncharacterized protein (DUF58 family)